MIGEIESVALQRGLVQIWYTQKIVSKKFTMIFAICSLQTGKSNKNIRIFPLEALGAGDRGRTDTVFLPQDFESSASANSTTPAYISQIISERKRKIK